MADPTSTSSKRDPKYHPGWEGKMEIREYPYQSRVRTLGKGVWDPTVNDVVYQVVRSDNKAVLAVRQELLKRNTRGKWD
jgi:hypothetical protein